MTETTPILQRFFEQVGPFVSRLPGTHVATTPLPRLKIMSSTTPTAPTPTLFKPMFYSVLQGTKVLALGSNRFELVAGECAATSFGLPFVGHFEKATRT